MNQATDEKNRAARPPRLPKVMKLLAFASICFVALLPSVIIGFFQQVEFAKQSVNQLALHLTTLVHQSDETSLSPHLAVATTQNNRLVLWSTYYRGEIVVARSGLPASPGAEQKLPLIQLNPRKKITGQLPPADLVSFSTADYRLRLPLGVRDDRAESLEIGVSYAALYVLAQDNFALSTVMFLTAFLFLLGAAVFVDMYISRFTLRVIRAIRADKADLEAIEGTLYSPSFNLLMQALERREDQVLDTRDTLETVFDGLQIGVAMVSTELKIVLVNHYLIDLLKAPPEERLISEPCSVLNLPGQQPSVEELCRRTLQSLKFESIDISTELNGDTRYLVQEAYPLFGADQTPVAIILQCRDVTAERTAHLTISNFNRELRRQLEDQRKQLEEAHQKFLQSSRLAAIGELAGGVAHEINNPNGVILAGARYVLNRAQSDATIPEYVTKYLQRIVKQSEHVADIVRALLTFSRRRPQQKSVLPICDAISDALELATTRFSHSKVEYVSELADTLPYVEGNRNELAQVFLNLFNNAVDAMPSGGRISLTAEPAELKGALAIRVRVRDSGEGIPADLLDKVMEPFFTTKPVGKGTGLGLSISHGIIEEHSGTMTVRNHPEGGAEFELLLPAVGKAPEGEPLK